MTKEQLIKFIEKVDMTGMDGLHLYPVQDDYINLFNYPEFYVPQYAQRFIIAPYMELKAND